jgi:hypothetical protein
VGGWVFGKKVSLRTTSQLCWDVVKNTLILRKCEISKNINIILVYNSVKDS